MITQKDLKWAMVGLTFGIFLLFLMMLDMMLDKVLP